MAVNATIVDCRASGKDDTLFRFIIMDAPSPSTLPAYVRELQKHKVQHLVRVCGQTYKSDIVEKAGIHVHGFPFDDGAPPPQNVVESWLRLLESEKSKRDAALGGVANTNTNGANAGTSGSNSNSYSTIAVHCVAGLGRAPILVALALVEYGGLPPLEAIEMVRMKRKGAINQVQLNWLSRYKPRSKGTSEKWECCVIQ